MKVFVVIIAILNVANCANILAFFYFPSISHQFVFREIAKELSLRGHQVTFVTPNPVNDQKYSNLTEIDVSVGYEVYEMFMAYIRVDEMISAKPYDVMIQKNLLNEYILARQFETPGVKQLMNKPMDSFDLILIEAFAHGLYGLQHKFKAPLIAVSSLGAFSNFHHAFGNPTHPVLYPDILTYISGPITGIINKINSAYFILLDYYVNEFHVLPSSDKLMRSYFGEDMPYLGEMIKQTSLLFLNANPLFSDRRPLAPNVIEFYNVHLKRDEILPSDLQEILDNAKNGVVYFSLGTNVRFSFFEGNFTETLMKVFADLPYTVLCKWESDEYPGKPKNVILRKWLPQQSILAHPNMKVFVTQGGLQSSEEAISNGVPLVVIPFLGDQPMNAEILTKQGMAETISPAAFNKDNLRQAILKVANDEKYRLKAQEVRSIFLDQPQSALDNIAWWCEYVIRHKGAKHLRSPSADIPLYEYFMLDVFAVFFTTIYVAYKVLCTISRIILRLVFKGKRVEKKTKQKKQ